MSSSHTDRGQAHDHDHDDDRQAHAPIHDDGASNPYAQRIQAIEALLIEKGVVSQDELRRTQHEVASRTPADGARLVARAWVDPEFKARLIADPKVAASALGIDASTYAEIVVLENTEDVHHLVVCTLCSCYPRTLLGLPPDWYKSLSYRSRAVSEPRSVMREFGLELDERIEVRVLDSTADMRYLVLPRRPAGTEGMSEEELAKLVTRDSMIGVTDALEPAPVAVD